jgi:hypothetical protein
MHVYVQTWNPVVYVLRNIILIHHSDIPHIDHRVQVIYVVRLLLNENVNA